MRVSEFKTALFVVRVGSIASLERRHQGIEVNHVLTQEGKLILVARVEVDLTQFTVRERQLGFWDSQELLVFDVVD